MITLFGSCKSISSDQVTLVRDHPTTHVDIIIYLDLILEVSFADDFVKEMFLQSMFQLEMIPTVLLV
jgi:hypothetical protein